MVTMYGNSVEIQFSYVLQFTYCRYSMETVWIIYCGFSDVIANSIDIV
jgi:hypothetical protein